jgi:hypothetical protein
MAPVLRLRKWQRVLVVQQQAAEMGNNRFANNLLENQVAHLCVGAAGNKQRTPIICTLDIETLQHRKAEICRAKTYAWRAPHAI